MLKKTFTYIDFNGDVRTEDAYFNLTETEITALEVEHEEGLLAKLKRIVDANDGPTIMKEFKDLILASYGEKSIDGRYFRKSKEISEAFACTPMYNELYMELLTNPEAASAFIDGIVPKEKTAEQKEALSKTNFERLSAEVEKKNIVPMPTAAPTVTE